MTRAVFLACACYRTIEPRTAASRELLLLNTPDNMTIAGTAIGHGYSACGNIENMMNEACRVLPDDGLFLYHDADMSFDPSDAGELVAEHEVFAGKRVVIGAIYPHRLEPGVTVGALGHCDADDKGPDGSTVESVLAKRLGFGFIAIPVALLRELPAPRMREHWDGHDLLTPDTLFCRSAQEHGYELRAMVLDGVKHLLTQWRGQNG